MERKSVAALIVYVLFRAALLTGCVINSVAESTNTFTVTAAGIFHNYNLLLNRVYALSGSVFDMDLTAFENEKINSNAPNVQLTGSAMQTPV